MRIIWASKAIGSTFTLKFAQIKEKASKDQQVIETALANPKDKFKIGIRKLIEGLMSAIR